MNSEPQLLKYILRTLQNTTSTDEAIEWAAGELLRIYAPKIAEFISNGRLGANFTEDVAFSIAVGAVRNITFALQLGTIKNIPLQRLDMIMKLNGFRLALRHLYARMGLTGQLFDRLERASPQDPKHHPTFQKQVYGIMDLGEVYNRARLSPREKLLFSLRSIEDLSEQEIADLTDLEVDEVQIILRNTKRKLLDAQHDLLSDQDIFW